MATKDVVQPAILATLIERDAYRYEVLSQLNHRLYGIVTIVKSRFYENHKTLVAGGLLEETGEMRGESKCYRTTEQGRSEFLAWIEKPRDPEKESALDYVRLRLRLAPHLTLQRLGTMIKDLERDVLAGQTRIGVPRELSDIAPSDRDVAQRFSEELDQRLATAVLHFVTDAREILDEVALARERSGLPR